MAYTVRRRAETPFLEAFASGASIKDAAKTADIAESTAHRWLNLPEINDRFNALRAERFLKTADNIISVTPLTRTCLRQLLECDKPWVALWAANACFKFTCKLSKELDVESALMTLRRLVECHGENSCERRRSKRQTDSLTPNPRKCETEANVQRQSKALISDVQTAEILEFEMRVREYQRRRRDDGTLTSWERNNGNGDLDCSRVRQNAGLPPGGRPAFWRTRLRSKSDLERGGG